MYKVAILIKGKDGTVIVDKNFKTESLEGILIINGADLYAEAQQSEIAKGLDLMSDEEFDDEQYNQL